MGSQDTEITLGTGKMLTLFFGLVALCGLFFGLGFSLGRGSVRPLASGDQLQTSNGPALHPSAMKSGGGQTQNSGDMTFYKAVENKDAGAGPADAAKDEAKADNAKPADNDAAKSGPPDPMTAASGPGYFVQVAAVSKQDDAQALVDALKKKQYAAFTASTSPGDKLFHVQVGPFGDLKEAEATKAKLVSDGYNPILKR
jgi:DedD protein